MKPFVYLFIDLGCILIPLIASFYPKHAFYKQWKYFFPANLIVAILFLVWDFYFTKNGIWGFNPDYLTGIYIANLPIEEVLFFICVPYACVFTYFAFNFLIKKNPFQGIQKYISIFAVVVLFMIGITSLELWYTALTFLLTSLYLLFCILTNKDLSKIYLAYFAILPFFLISNGLLTGSILEAPIVWYNDSENLGFRIGTIPIEDSIYGFLLIILNIHLYKYFKSLRY